MAMKMHRIASTTRTFTDIFVFLPPVGVVVVDVVEATDTMSVGCGPVIIGVAVAVTGAGAVRGLVCSVMGMGGVVMGLGAVCACISIMYNVFFFDIR